MTLERTNFGTLHYEVYNQSELSGHGNRIGKVTQLVLERILTIFLTEKKRELQNVQVIIKRIDGSYDLNIISKEKLWIMDKSKNLLEVLAGWSYIPGGKKTKNEKISIYEAVLHNILSDEENFSLIESIIRSALSDGEKAKYGWCAEVCLQIQINMRGGRELDKNYSYLANKMKLEGKKLRNIYEGVGDSKRVKEADDYRKTKSLAYKLLNALQSEDRERFLDISYRVYIGSGLLIPEIFIRMNDGIEMFKILGFAFVLGLMGEEYKDKSDNEDATNDKTEFIAENA